MGKLDPIYHPQHDSGKSGTQPCSATALSRCKGTRRKYLGRSINPGRVLRAALYDTAAAKEIREVTERRIANFWTIIRPD